MTGPHTLAAVNPAKIMAATVIDLLNDGAGSAQRVVEQCTRRLSRSEYLDLRRTMDSSSRFPD